MISRISRNAVKEGFDTLPAAICYFDRNGLLRLINHRMQEIAAVLCGRDLQTLTDLEQALRSPGGGVRLRDEAARIYKFPDGTVYHFTVRPVQDKYGTPYTEVMATDVSWRHCMPHCSRKTSALPMRTAAQSAYMPICPTLCGRKKS